MFLVHREKNKNLADERCWRKKTAGENTLSKSYQSLFRKEDTISMCLKWQRKLPFIWMILKGFLSLLVLTLSQCFGGLLSSHLDISVVDMVLTAGFEGWETLFILV